MLAYEKEAKKAGFHSICGIDEAGRGPLAGPVIAAACILPEHVFQDPLFLSHLDDSKKMTSELREDLFHILSGHPGVKYGIGVASHEEIDTINILQATRLAMQRAVSHLFPRPDLLLVDGEKLVFEGISFRKIIKGDQLSLSIAAASVLAKVTRDRQMIALHKEYPVYGFDRHKGYGTPAHLKALEEHGPCPLHRKTFAPVSQALAQSSHESLLEAF